MVTVLVTTYLKKCLHSVTASTPSLLSPVSFSLAGTNLQHCSSISACEKCPKTMSSTPSSKLLLPSPPSATFNIQHHLLAVGSRAFYTLVHWAHCEKKCWNYSSSSPPSSLYLPMHWPRRPFLKPGWQSHSKLPGVLMHLNWQLWRIIVHSSRSVPQSKIRLQQALKNSVWG